MGWNTDKVKQIKKAFINSLIASSVDYQVCGEISAVLNKYIADKEAQERQGEDADSDLVKGRSLLRELGRLSGPVQDSQERQGEE